MNEPQTITREELKSWMDEGKDFVLIDALSPESYAKSHLPGAINVRGRGIDDDPEGYAERVREQVPDMGTTIVVYCRSFTCQLSTKTSRALVNAGFTNVYDFEGGLADWIEAGYPLEGSVVEEGDE